MKRFFVILLLFFFSFMIFGYSFDEIKTLSDGKRIELGSLDTKIETQIRLENEFQKRTKIFDYASIACSISSLGSLLILSMDKKNSITVVLGVPCAFLGGSLLFIATKPKSNVVPTVSELKMKRFTVQNQYDRIAYALQQYNSLEQVYIDAIIDGKLIVGLPGDAVPMILGEPQRINTAVTESGKNEQYVYDNNRYVYVVNGIITGFQY